MVRPNYPSKARKQKIYGEVVITGVVGADGKLRMITTSGQALLEEAAMKAVQEWRYKPPTLNGDPVETTARIVFNFSQPD
jgi:protein TonB